jgi:peptidase U32-like protein
VHVLEDIRRSADAGIRSVLVTDLGVLTVAAKMREAGELPVDLQFKVSVQMGLANPAAARLAEQAGANTYNVPADLSLAQLAAIRAAMDIPLDIYVEADDLGGSSGFEIAEIVALRLRCVSSSACAQYLPQRYAPHPHRGRPGPRAGPARRDRAGTALGRYAPDAVGSAAGGRSGRAALYPRAGVSRPPSRVDSSAAPSRTRFPQRGQACSEWREVGTAMVIAATHWPCASGTGAATQPASGLDSLRS